MSFTKKVPDPGTLFCCMGWLISDGRHSCLQKYFIPFSRLIEPLDDTMPLHVTKAAYLKDLQWK